MQDYKDGSGLQFIKFDFLTCGQEIKIDGLKSMEQNKSSSLKKECRITRIRVDYSSLILIFLTGAQEIKVSTLLEF